MSEFEFHENKELGSLNPMIAHCTKCLSKKEANIAETQQTVQKLFSSANNKYKNPKKRLNATEFEIGRTKQDAYEIVNLLFIMKQYSQRAKNQKFNEIQSLQNELIEKEFNLVFTKENVVEYLRANFINMTIYPRNDLIIDHNSKTITVDCKANAHGSGVRYHLIYTFKVNDKQEKVTMTRGRNFIDEGSPKE